MANHSPRAKPSPGPVLSNLCKEWLERIASKGPGRGGICGRDISGPCGSKIVTLWSFMEKDGGPLPETNGMAPAGAKELIPGVTKKVISFSIFSQSWLLRGTKSQLGAALS